MPPTPPEPDAGLSALLSSWELSLRAERKSDQTLKSYLGGVQRSTSLDVAAVTTHARSWPA